MSVEYNGKEYDIAPEMLQGAIVYVESFLGSLKGDAKTTAIEKLLGVGKSLVKKNARAERNLELDHVKELVVGDVDFAEFATKAAKAFARASKGAKEYESILGAIPLPKTNGDGYTIVMPVSEFKLGSILPFTGEIDKVKVLLNEDAPEAPPDGGYALSQYHIYAEIDLPDLDQDFAEFRELRQKALDAAAVFTKPLTNYKSGLNPDGTFYLLDASARVSGEKRGGGGTRNKVGIVKWNGKEYTGSAREILNAVVADGYKAADHVSKWPAQILEGKVKGFEVRPQAATE